MSWFSDAVDSVGSYFGDDMPLSDQIDPTSWFGGTSPTSPVSNTSNNSNSSSFLSAVGAGLKGMNSQKDAQGSSTYSLIQQAKQSPQIRYQVNPVDINPRQPPSNSKAAQAIDGMSVQNYWMSNMKSLANGAPK